MNQVLEHYIIGVQELVSQRKIQQIPEFVATASQLFVNTQFLATTLDNVLETFDTHEHTFGVLQILLAKHSILKEDDSYTRLFEQSKDFIEKANSEQLSLINEMFCDLCHSVALEMIKRGKEMRAIPVLQTAITKLQKNPTDLTGAHGILCQLCLMATCFEPALCHLDVDVTEIVKTAHQPAKYFLLYFYYGGMIYTALKNYDRAIFFFEAAVTTDSHVVSHIVLEAYKKRILVSLIYKGSVDPLPRWTSPVVERFAHQVTKVYHDLEATYASSSVSEVREFCARNRDHFNKDNNAGLIKQMISSLTRKNIKKLTKTFLTLSLADVAQRCELTDAKQAERQLFNMIEDGEIFATINQKDGMVLFRDNPKRYNDPNCFLDLEEKMRRYIAINDKIRLLSEEILLDPQYLQRLGHDDEQGMAGVASTSSSSAPRPGPSRQTPTAGWHRF